MVRKAGIIHCFGQRQKFTFFERLSVVSFFRILSILLLLIVMAFSTDARSSETGVVYRAKRGTDAYFKSVKYKKTLFISYAELWAEHFDIPTHVIKGQIEQESGWDNNITSHKGARGLMQVMPETAYCKDFLCLKASKDESLHNPYTNIYYGCKYMRMMLDRFDNNLTHALMAYYGGPYRMKLILAGKVRSKSLIAEIEGYAENVFQKSVKYLELNQISGELIDGVEPVPSI